MKNEKIYSVQNVKKKINKICICGTELHDPEMYDLFHPFIKWNPRKKILHEVVKMPG